MALVAHFLTAIHCSHIRSSFRYWDLVIMRKLKKILYTLGFRPKAGSIFHSPSLAIHHYFRDEEIRRQKDRFDRGYE